MKELTFVAPCLLGLEGICANELKYNGIENAKAENGKVVFKGDYYTLAKANIISRYAQRIQILLSEFTAKTFDDLYQGVKNINFEDFIGITDAFPVKGKSLNSALRSIPDCQKIIKKAAVDRLSSVHMVPWFEETGPIHQIQFLIMKDKVSIMLDTSGESLHKRGYRQNANEAPIKETLAAGMVDLARVRSNHFVVDPMCGSGTILIEAALKAMKIAPGINRSFAAEKWSQIPSNVWKKAREEAKSQENRDCDFKAIGYDIDDEAIKISKFNAEKAGVSHKIKFLNRDIKEFQFDSEYETVITNPPYGERLLDINEAEKLYKIMGQKFKQQRGKSYTIISPDDDFEKLFGRKADKRRKLYNGMLKCQVYMYYK